MLKYLARNIVAPTLYASGFDRVISHFSRKKGLIIIYHGIIPHDNLKYNSRQLLLGDFKKQIEYLSKHFRIISLTEMFHRYRSGIEGGERCLSITFDDGYENNYKYAYPTLRDLQIPSTFFVCTQLFDENRILWNDIIDVYIQHIGEELAYEGFKFVRTGPKTMIDTSRKIDLRQFVRSLDPEAHQAFIEHVKAAHGIASVLAKIDTDFWRLMSSEQVREIAEHELMEVGSHTHSHYELSKVHPDAAREELTKSKETLEAQIQQEVKAIAFPYGSYSVALKEHCLSQGYENLCAVDYQFKEDELDPSILPRFGISATTNLYSNMVNLHLNLHKVGL